MSDQNPFQSSNVVTATTASGQENQQPQEAQQQQDKKAGADKNSDESLYVSPSDAIMSPASQKLSSFKQRQINKYAHDDYRIVRKNAKTNMSSQLGTAVTPPAAPSSLVTCPLPKVPKTKNPSDKTCCVSSCTAAGSAKFSSPYTCTTTEHGHSPSTPVLPLFFFSMLDGGWTALEGWKPAMAARTN